MSKLQKMLCHSLAAVVLALAATTAQAVPLSILLGGGSLTAGGLLFDQWQQTFQNNSPGVSAPNTGLIHVTALNDGGHDPGPGLAFATNGQFNVAGDGVYAFSDYTFAFRVSSLSGVPIIKDNLLSLINPALSFVANGREDLGVAIYETIRDSLGNIIGRKHVEFSRLNGVPTSILTDHASWSPDLSEIFVEKNILVWAVNQGDVAALVDFEQRFSLPEPASLSLFSLGMLLAVRGRRRIQ